MLSESGGLVRLTLGKERANNYYQINVTTFHTMSIALIQKAVEGLELLFVTDATILLKLSRFLLRSDS